MGTAISLYDWQVVGVTAAGVVHLGALASSRDVFHDDAAPDFTKVVEVCSGLAGTTFGACFAGRQSLGTLDHSQLAVDNLRLNEHQNVLKGSVENRQDWYRLHASIHGVTCGLLVGFPCQPFGRLGKHEGFEDRRAHVFYIVPWI